MFPHEAKPTDEVNPSGVGHEAKPTDEVKSDGTLSMSSADKMRQSLIENSR